MENVVDMDVGEKYPGLGLPEDQLQQFLTWVGRRRSSWQNWELDAREDDSEFRKLIADILGSFSLALAGSHLDGDIIGVLSPPQAKKLVKELTDSEIRELRDALQKGLQNDEWETLITHPRFRKKHHSPSTSEIAAEKAKWLNQMFLRTYRGEAVDQFVAALKQYGEIYNPKRHFGRCIPIVQSSGTGKSRLVEELGNKEVTLSVCFRDSSEPTAGWPPGDAPAYEFLMERREKPNYKAEEIATAFLGALMHVVAAKLERQDPSDPSPKAWMTDWHLDTPTQSSRHKSFLLVKDKAEELLQTVIDDMRTAAPNAKENDVLRWHHNLYRFVCAPHVHKLSQALKKLHHDSFIIAFDECSHLEAESSREPQCLVALLRIIKAGDNNPIDSFNLWYVLLDKNLSTFGLPFEPSGPRTSSSRLTEPLVTLPP